MKRETFVTWTRYTRAFISHGAWAKWVIDIPTFLCAFLYIAAGIQLFFTRDARLCRFVLVPGCTYVLATLLRKVIKRPRPCAVLDFEPVGNEKRGKGKSFPSRHAASAAAIAFAFSYAFAHPLVTAFGVLLCALVALSRVAKGAHYPSDVLFALAFSAICAWIGYGCI